MRQIFILIFLASVSIVKGQDIVEWDGNYQLKLSDFQSPTTEIGGSTIYSLQTSSSMYFAFQ